MLNTELIMDTFNFTKKKFAALKPETRHKHIINWLGGIYQKLITNRLPRASVDQAFARYREILSWLDMPCPKFPAAGDTRAGIEFISDAIHCHRLETGQVPRDHDLLERVDPPHGAGITTKDAGPEKTSLRRFDYHIALDGLRSVFNVGSVFRTCDAAGFSSVILGNPPGREHPGVCKTAMNAHAWVDQEKTDDLAGCLMTKKEAGYPVIGIETIPGSLALHEVTWPQKAILVFGNEEYGISAHVRRSCDTFAHIPMYGRKNSLNVGCAVSAVCFHILSRTTPVLNR